MLIIACVTCAFSHAFKKEDWYIKDASGNIYHLARSVTSRSFSGWSIGGSFPLTFLNFSHKFCNILPNWESFWHWWTKWASWQKMGQINIPNWQFVDQNNHKIMLAYCYRSEYAGHTHIHTSYTPFVIVCAFVITHYIAGSLIRTAVKFMTHLPFFLSVPTTTLTFHR